MQLGNVSQNTPATRTVSAQDLRNDAETEDKKSAAPAPSTQPPAVSPPSSPAAQSTRAVQDALLNLKAQ